jgi:alkylation response protein AidB-like acyl-CoA dehydrogenase
METIRSPAQGYPAPVKTTAHENNGTYTIDGVKSFVYGLGEADTYVVLARIEDDWACFAVSADAEGVMVTDEGWRTGLRACAIQNVAFKNVMVPQEARVDRGSARYLACRALTLAWTGMAAVAAGIARGAVKSARQYMSERYQCGTIIENHPAMKMLLAGAEAKAETVMQALSKADDSDLESDKSLKRAASLKLMATTLCSEAVTDCLQTFGGYGYMEDFGMEKRLRDITMLKSGLGPPFYLKQFIFDSEV